MVAVMKWSGDGLTAGAFSTASVGSGDSAPSAVVGSGLALVGSGTRAPQIQVTPPAGGAETSTTWVFPSQSQGGGRFYWTSPSALPASGQIPYFFEMYSGANRLWSLDFTSTGRFNLRSNTAVLQQGATGMVQPSTQYRVEWTFSNATNTVSVNIFEGESRTLYLSLGGVATVASSHDSIKIGRMNGGASNPYQYDDLIVTNTLTFPGPWTAPISDTSIFRYTGGDWIPVTPVMC